MPINPDAVGETAPPEPVSWTSKDALLYALGVGAGVDDLPFTTENSMNIDQLVLPTMGVVLMKVVGVFAKMGSFNPAMLVHGSQRIELFGDIPPEGSASSVAEITGIFDKGKGALVEITSTTTLDGEASPLFRNVMGAFIRGEGGWGGERGASASVEVPSGKPDVTISYPTSRDQALLYRLSGDRNPLHSDPSFAKIAGFGQPILHGLCTYGFTGRALLAGLCEGDPTRFGMMDGRFSSPVIPGDTLTVDMWRTESGAVFRTSAQDGRVVIDSGSFAAR